MGVERKFVKSGLDRAQIGEYFGKQLERAGYGGMNINRTPMGTQVTIYAEKPGMIIGKGGKTIHKLTHDLEAIFRIDNPQIDVQEVRVPELNAQMMASRLAGAIERGLYFRKAGHNMLRRIMESGAHGCEIAGNMLHAGNPAMELVDKGFAIAIKKLGIIGCRVRIVPPSVTLPGRFMTVKGAEPQAQVSKKPGIAELVKPPVEAKPEEEVIKQQAGTPPEQNAEHAMPEGNFEERMHGDVKEHKHAGYEYWHPASRMHKTEEN
jgi:small subunit ribosomal protein S3